MQLPASPAGFSITVSQLARFDELIDVRSPAEFALDHIVNAINLPVLSDSERSEVGKQYKQISSFSAKRVGAAHVARHIAEHLEYSLADKPKDWHPLVYCWRGGSRSAAMVDVLHKIGWAATQLPGGYKAYRRQVNDDFLTLPNHFHYRVITGPTGSGKSQLLDALQARGLQVLNLEQLACHRGSVLGELPDKGQPSQKLFESLLWHRLQHFDLAFPVFVESESQKIGCLRVPMALLNAMRQGQCINLVVPMKARVEYLQNLYTHFLDDPERLNAKLMHLARLRSVKSIAHWQTLAKSGRWDSLVEALLAEHYDPGYEKSIKNNFTLYAQAQSISITSLDAESFSATAKRIAES